MLEKYRLYFSGFITGDFPPDTERTGNEDQTEAHTQNQYYFSAVIPGETVLRSQTLAQQLKELEKRPELAEDPIQMALDWVYVDETRFDFGYRLFGLPFTPGSNQLLGHVEIENGEGEPVPVWDGSSDVNW
ncbi:MAG: hypothetical protein AB9907_04115 [Flexilinea sp.]